MGGNSVGMSGDQEKAIADYRRALELAPFDKDTKQGLKHLGAPPEQHAWQIAAVGLVSAVQRRFPQTAGSNQICATARKRWR
ncbi:tetratricopeptide repeat protein [Nitratireductor sp. XY-223]|uniref:tetratricopeptide repeat protein n=1 Tax=Nitratireductor sp. XY-223 TaxID=2561926 RepID=UPI0010AA2ED9|nr:tetratricopeptide repeat protein [Nitratireductor sp. XY-223]